MSTVPVPKPDDTIVEDLVASNSISSTATELPISPNATRSGNPNGLRSKRRYSKRRGRTNHLKDVPVERELRDLIRAHCRQLASGMNKHHPLSREELEKESRNALEQLSLPERYLGWTMVILMSEFWHDQIAFVPTNRRLLLLPHCLKHTEDCPADYDQYGLDCRRCGACCIADFRIRAEQLGYKVLVAEDSPIVLKIIVSGQVDAIIGVACQNVLEKAFEKVLLAGIPCMAVPLLSSDCRNTSVDEDWVSEMIEARGPATTVRTHSYLPLLRAARGMFQPEQLQRLAPRIRAPRLRSQNIKPRQDEPGPTNFETTRQHSDDFPCQDNPLLEDPIAATESLAYDYLAKGGKYARPFITLAAYEALAGSARDIQRCSENADPRQTAQIPDAVYRVALSIETFHKASLVHDDIEDNDAFRYGKPTLHRAMGLPTAINVGDYMIGLGYRLVSRELASLGAEVAGEILDRLADAHLRLSEGQGAELLWRDAGNKQLSPLDAMKIYALKTAPAFEAALLCGLRCAAPLGSLEQPLKQLSRQLGIAFQILNDLNDWQGDQDNKLSAGLDTLGGRPTLLWALALESLGTKQRAELLQIVGQPAKDRAQKGNQPHDNNRPPNGQPRTESANGDAHRIARVRQLYQQAGVFEQACQLVEKYRQRAEAIAADMEPERLRRLLFYLIDTMLQSADAPP